MYEFPGSQCSTGSQGACPSDHGELHCVGDHLPIPSFTLTRSSCYSEESRENRHKGRGF